MDDRSFVAAIKWPKALQVSIDYLVPLFDVPGATQVKPSAFEWKHVGQQSLDYADFATILSFLGWILVPAGIGVIVGKLRRSP
jgi:hypothetical protein